MKEARAGLTKSLPDIVILDLSLRDSDGLELMKDIRSKYQHLPVLILSMHDESIYAERLLSAGANGYIMKQAAADQLLTAVRRVLAGGIYVSDSVGASMIERFAVSGRVQAAHDPIARLSNRELQVLNLIGRGKSDARDRGRSEPERQDGRIAPPAHQEEAQSHHSPQLVQFAVNWYSSHH